LDLIFQTLGNDFCVTAPHKDVSVAQAFLVEFAATVVLIGVCTGLWDPRNAKHGDSIPIKFGFTVAALAMVAGPYTGCKILSLISSLFRLCMTSCNFQAA
jgi:aquaporin rerated protein, invertebrate